MSDYEFSVSPSVEDEYVLYEDRQKKLLSPKDLNEFLVAFTSCVVYLQYVGLFLLPGIDLNEWDSYFGWVQGLLLFSTEEIDEKVELILFVMKSALLWLSLFALRLATTSNQTPARTISDCSMMFFYLIFPGLIATGVSVSIVLAFLSYETAALIVFLGTTTILFLYFLLAFKLSLLKRSDTLNIFRSCWIMFMTPFVLSWTDTLRDVNVTNSNFVVFILGSIFVLVFFIFDCFVSVYQSDYGSQMFRKTSLLKYLTFCLFGDLSRQMLNEHIKSVYQDKLFMFSPLELMERIVLCIILRTAINDIDVEDGSSLSNDLIPLFSLYSLTTLMIAFFLPYKSITQNIIGIMSRVSNLILLGISWYVIEGSPHNELIDEDEIAITNIVLFVNSGVVFIFWIYFLSLKQVGKSVFRVIRIFSRPRKLTRIRREWEGVNTLEGATRLLSSEHAIRAFGECEWLILSPSKKLLSLCVPRDDFLYLKSFGLREFDLLSAPYTRSLGVNGMHSLINICSLSLISSGLSVSHLRALAETESLELMPSLITLNLSNNKFGSEGLEMLMKCLMMENNSEKSFSLTSLLLANCDLDLDAGEMLKEYLEENRDMEYLSVSKNCLCDKGGLDILESIGETSNLQVLRLDSNLLTERLLIDGKYNIREATKLTELWLTDNCLTGEGVEELLEDCEELGLVVLSIGKQRPQRYLHRIVDDAGVQKVSNMQRKVIGLDTNLLGVALPRAQNALLRALLECPKLRSATLEDQCLRSCFKKDIVFDLDKKSNAVEFSQRTYEYTERGLCCFLPVALLLLKEENLEGEIAKIIDVPNENGYTVLEMCVLYGASSIDYAAKVLIQFGANLMANSVSSPGKRVLDLAMEHEVENVSKWANTYEEERHEEYDKYGINEGASL